MQASLLNSSSHDQHTTILKELANSIDFVAVSVHRWRGQYNIRDAMVSLGDVELSREFTTRPRWNLMPKEWQDKFTKIESHIKSVISRAAVVGSDNQDDSDDLQEILHLPLRGVHVVPRCNRSKFFNEIQEIENIQFKPLVVAFGEEWPEIVNGVRESLTKEDPRLWRLVCNRMPTTATAVMERCWIEKLIIPIALDFDDVVVYDANEIMASGKAFAERAANVIVNGLENELKAAVDNLVNRIDEKGVIKEGTLSMVRNAFEKFKAFDFLMTNELRTKLVCASAQLGMYDCKDLNRDLKEAGAQSVTVGLANHLRELREQCATDMAAARMHGRGRRNIKT